MARSNLATPLAVLAAGMMISAAIYFRPMQICDAGHPSAGTPPNCEIGRGPSEVPARPMVLDALPKVPEGWKPPSDDEMRRLLDEWEKAWLLDGETDQSPYRVHSGLI